MKILCNNKDCKHFFADGCTAGTVEIDEFGRCRTFDPIHLCGECAKFHNETCCGFGEKYPELSMLIEADDPASMDCFAERSEDSAAT